jgi:hypothetical protein
VSSSTGGTRCLLNSVMALKTTYQMLLCRQELVSVFSMDIIRALFFHNKSVNLSESLCNFFLVAINSYPAMKFPLGKRGYMLINSILY